MMPGTPNCLLALLGSASVSTLTYAADNPAQTAEFQVTDILLESACYLDPSSTYQTLDLRDLSTAQLIRTDEQGTPVTLQLNLQGCVRSDGGRLDEQTGTLIWSASEPEAALSFTAVADAGSSGLIEVVGAGGFGLRLLDVQGRDVRLGPTAPARFISPGNSQPLITSALNAKRHLCARDPSEANLKVNLAYD